MNSLKLMSPKTSAGEQEDKQEDGRNKADKKTSNIVTGGAENTVNALKQLKSLKLPLSVPVKGNVREKRNKTKVKKGENVFMSRERKMQKK